MNRSPRVTGLAHLVWEWTHGMLRLTLEPAPPDGDLHRDRAGETVDLLAHLAEWDRAPAWTIEERDGGRDGILVLSTEASPQGKAILITAAAALLADPASCPAALARYGPLGIPEEDIDRGVLKEKGAKLTTPWLHPSLETAGPAYAEAHPGHDGDILLLLPAGLERPAMARFGEGAFLLNGVSGVRFRAGEEGLLTTVTVTPGEGMTLPGAGLVLRSLAALVSTRK